MKVHRLWIGDYRVLRDIEIRFSPHGTVAPQAYDDHAVSPHALDLLVGVNGTGKSTVLRALVEVFRRIAGNSGGPDLLFSVTYERAADEVITIENVDEEKQPLPGKLRVWRGRDAAPVEMDDVRELAPKPYVTYTTGREAWWDDAAEPLDEAIWAEATRGSYWLRERPEGTGGEAGAGRAGSSPDHIQVTAHDLTLVTLCGLLEDATRGRRRGILSEALEDLGIRGMSAFSLRFNAGERGAPIRRQLEALTRVAARTRLQGASLTFVFDFASRPGELLDALNVVFGAANAAELFQKLAGHERARPGELRTLEQVELFLERRRPGKNAPPPELHTYDWLSDGERTFLGRMCMLSLFGATGALLLLDEPEVHFNDYWKRKLVRLLDRAMEGHHSHAIVTTHSSIVLTDARVSQITVLDRSEDGYTRRPLKPGVPTFASDPSDVLVHVFGAEQASGAKSVDEVGTLLRDYELAVRSGLPTTRLERLRARLEEIQTALGPGYWRFRVADALRERPRADAPQA